MELSEKNLLLKFLKNHVVLITFVKKNGDERVMTATLKNEFVNDGKPMLLQEHNGFSENQIRVWDMDIQAWRSFLIETVKDTRILS